jgi:predicted Zn-dependent protease
MLLIGRCMAQGVASSSILLPELGDASSFALSARQERRIGMEVFRQIRRDSSYMDDPEAAEYLNLLGNSLVAASSMAGQGFEFFLIADPAINAFALPGGFVGIHSGLVLAAQSESELASVVAHEISHVTQRHIARGIGSQQQLSVASLAGAILAVLAARNGSQAGQAIAMASQASAAQAQLAYTRDFEREADRIGIELLMKAGFDVGGMVTFFERLQRATRLQENNAPGYLRTHPLTIERISDMQNRMQSSGYRQHIDRIEFQLVRARLRSEQDTGRRAFEHFEQQIKEGRFANEGAAYYGAAFSALRMSELDVADQRLRTARRLLGWHPMLDLLEAKVAAGRGDGQRSLSIIRSSLARRADFRPTYYAEAATLQRLGLYQQALDASGRALGRYPRDAKLLAAKAAAHASLGQVFLSHQNQAESYVLQGALPSAIEQLQLGLKAGDANFYQLSSGEARLRELRQILFEESRGH